MKPRFRKLVLTAHITASIGWLGAVLAYLALAIVGLTSSDEQIVRAVYLSMDMVGWFVVVPLCLAALLTGLVESLGTPWGLFRHWWIATKLLLTMGATIILLQHMPIVTRLASAVADTGASAVAGHALRIQLVVHAGGGLLVLLTATVLSVYKPWGMTPYGLRVQRPWRADSIADSFSSSESAMQGRSLIRLPRWRLVVGFHALGVALLLFIIHLVGGSLQSH